MKKIRLGLTALSVATLASSSSSFAQVLDMDISRIGDGVNNYGVSGGIRAYSFSTTSCNIGDQVLAWNDSINEAPVIAQNMFWMNEGRFEQLGYSFLKEGFCAVNENSCGSCQTTNCDTLGIGCADTYGAGLNDGRSGATKSLINANTGAKPANLTGPTSGNNTIRGRLQVSEAALETAGALFFIESQYVTTDDQLAGNHRNNVSWRRMNVNANNKNLTVNGLTQRDEPAIYAWQANDADATIVEFSNDDEGGAGVHGYYFVGFKTTDLGNGLWRYEYAVQNTTSNVAANSFALSLPCGAVTATDVYFKDVESHSGDPYASTDWTFSESATELRWTGPDFASEPLGNALRWGTLYNFGFTADAAPSFADATIGLFEGGGEVSATIQVPGTGMENYCTATANSTGGAARLVPSGSTTIGNNDVSMQATQLPANTMGYFLMSDGQTQAPLSFSQGNLCVGGNGATIYRFSNTVLNSGLFGFVEFDIDLLNLPQGVVVQSGETWNFQYWFRDMNPMATSNTTDAVAVEFCN